jgi:hypothetical protein
LTWVDLHVFARTIPGFDRHLFGRGAAGAGDRAPVRQPDVTAEHIDERHDLPSFAARAAGCPRVPALWIAAIDGHRSGGLR